MLENSFGLWVESKVVARGVGDAVAKDPVLSLMGVTYHVKAATEKLFEIYITVPFGLKIKATMDSNNPRTVQMKSGDVPIRDVPAVVKGMIPSNYIDFVTDLVRLRDEGLLVGEIATRLDEKSSYNMYAVVRPAGFADHVGLEVRSKRVYNMRSGAKGEGDIQKSIGATGGMSGSPIRFPNPTGLDDAIRFLVNDGTPRALETGARTSDDEAKERLKSALRKEGWLKTAASQFVHPFNAENGTFKFVCTLERKFNGMDIKYSGDVQLNRNDSIVYDNAASFDVTWGDMRLRRLQFNSTDLKRCMDYCASFAKSMAQVHRKFSEVRNGSMFYSYGYGDDKVISKNPIYDENMGHSNMTGFAENEEKFIKMLLDPSDEGSFVTRVGHYPLGAANFSKPIEDVFSRFTDGEGILSIGALIGRKIDRNLGSLAASIFGASGVNLLEGATDQRIAAIEKKIGRTARIDIVVPMMKTAREHFERTFPLTPNSNKAKRTEMIGAVSKWVVNTIIRKTDMKFIERVNDMDKGQRELVIKAVVHATKVACNAMPDVVVLTAPSYYTGEPANLIEISNQLLRVMRQNNTGLKDVQEIAGDYHDALRQVKMRAAPTDGTEVIKEFDNGLKWRLYARGGCPEEGAASGHCGNGQGRPGDRLLSLRTKDEKALATFVYNNGEIVEAKAAYNEKPREKLHPAIMWLITNRKPMGGTSVPEIKPIHGLNSSRSLPENDFHPNDLSPERLAKLKEERPDLFWKGRV